jgi:ABC-type phosphate/phosphonate transport system permease subunit
MLSRPLLNAAADESYADSAADDADDAEAAASAVTANALPPPVAPDVGGPGGDFIIMAWVIALLAAPIALMLVVLSGKQHFAARRFYREYGYGRLTSP